MAKVNNLGNIIRSKQTSSSNLSDEQIANAKLDLEKNGITPSEFNARLYLSGMNLNDLAISDMRRKAEVVRDARSYRERIFKEWAKKNLPAKYRNEYRESQLYWEYKEKWLAGKNIFMAGIFQIGKTRLGIELLKEGYINGLYSNMLFTSPAASSLRKNDEILTMLTSGHRYGIVLADLIEPKIPDWQLKDYFRVLKTILESNHQVYIDTNNSNSETISQIWGKKIYLRLIDENEFYFLWDHKQDKIISIKKDIREIKSEEKI